MKYNFDLESFVANCKNNNVKIFIDARIKQQRATVGVSAIGSLKKAGCPQDLLIELTERFCKGTGKNIKQFSTALYGKGTTATKTKATKIITIADTIYTTPIVDTLRKTKI
jgi:hypothetical protein